MEFTRQHVEHIVGRHHALARKFEALKGKFEGITAGTVETLEVSAGALVGGVIDGRFGSKEKGLPSLMHIPVTLGAGLALNIIGHLYADEKKQGFNPSAHLCNFGNGLLAAYLSSVGFHFGQSWQARGSLFAKKSITSGAPAGALGEQQMANILANLQQAAQPAG